MRTKASGKQQGVDRFVRAIGPHHTVAGDLPEHRASLQDMLAYQHSGFSVDAGVCIEAHDRAALERLLRYCARPPFAMERLRKEGASLVCAAPVK